MKHKHKSPSFLTSLSPAKIRSVPKLPLERVLSILKMVPPSQAVLISIEYGREKRGGGGIESVLAELSEVA